MAIQPINVGTSANKGNGDPLRTAFTKVNNNFTEVYAKLTALEDGSVVTDISGSVFADDSTLLVDGVNGKIVGDVATPSDWNITALNKTWNFGEDGDLTFPDATVQTTAWTGVADLARNIESEGDVSIRVNLTDSTTRIWQFGEDGILTLPSVGKISNGAYDWTFGTAGSLTLPGDLHGATDFLSAALPDLIVIGHTLNITPAPNVSDKKFGFRIDQTGETFDRAFLDMPTAENNKAVSLTFSHANNTIGNIFVQGTDSVATQLNNAFNIFYNSGDIKVTAQGPGSVLHTWNFGEDGNLTVPGDIQSENDVSIRINLSDSTTRTWRFGEDGHLTLPAGGDIKDSTGTSVLGGGTALPLVTITNANYNQDDTPVAPATSENEGAVVFTVTSSVALTATGLLLISGSNNKGGTIVPGGTSTGSQTLVFDMGVLNSVYTVIAFATTANGTSYSAPVAGNGGYVCFPAGTMITLSNGTKKAIEDIGYSDDILVWNFDLGVYASAKPIWIKASETATEYNVLTFSDGSVLKTVGNHHIFNKQAERFTHTMTADTPIGTVSINEQGEEITLVSAEVVKESVEFYNVWTEYHLNMFAEGVLTSNRFNNTYPIVSMKFVKGNTELRSLAEFNGIDPKWIQGLRLQEQALEHTAEYIKWYVSERLEKLSIDSVETVA